MKTAVIRYVTPCSLEYIH